MPDDPLDALLGQSGASPRHVDRESLEAVSAALSRHDPGEFVDAVTRACGLSWDGSQYRPRDWLELHGEQWWIDLDRPGNRDGLRSVMTAALLVDALNTTVGIGWVAKVLEAVSWPDATKITMRDGHVRAEVVLRTAPVLPEALRFTVNPVDFEEFVAAVRRPADGRTWLPTSAGGAVRLHVDDSLLGDRHVLSFLGVGPSGRYDQNGWTVRDLPISEPLLGVMVTAHEAHHAGLNSSTAWGALLQAVAVAAARLPSSSFPDVLAELVPRCRRTHEAYATHASLVNLIERAEVAELGPSEADDPTSLLDRFPAYRAYLDDALAIGPPLPLPNHWRQVAADSALMACMQPDVLQRITDAGLHRLTPAHLRDSEGPDHRYTILVEIAPQLWSGVEHVAAEVFGDRWKHLRTLDLRHPATRAHELEQVWEQLYRICMEASCQALDHAGLPTLRPEQVQRAVPALVAALTELVGADSTPMTLGTDARLGAFSLFQLERVEWHEPLPARIVRFGDIREVSDFASGGSAGRHLFVTVRTVTALRRQFAIEATALLPESGPVVAIQASRDDRVDLAVVTEPADLSRLAATTTGLRVVSSVSAACMRDTAWAAAWLPALRGTGMTMLLDLPLTPIIDAVLDAGHRLQYALVSVPTGEGPRYAYAIAIGADPPMLAPCTFTTGQALVNYTFLRSGGRIEPDITTLGSDLEVVRAAMEHLVQDESYADLAL